MKRPKIAVLGSGIVGEQLANGFIKHGHDVMRGSRTPDEKLAEWKRFAGEHAKIGTFEETAKFSDTIVLSVKGSGAVLALELCGVDNLRGKTIIDTTNPIADEPPINGVLTFFTDINHSLMETLQEKFPDAHFVKAFNCIGNAYMVDPQFGQKPTMFYCGNDDRSKAKTREILKNFGWEVADMGGAEAARAIEPLCMLWCIPGLREGSWAHAFKFLTK